MTFCYICPPGTYSGYGAQNCTLCPTGSANNISMATGCNVCDIGTYTNKT